MLSVITVPTEIEDHYRIVVETEFEANVPAPVVTVTPSVIDLEELEDEMQVNLVIENHGLIAANNFELQFDEHESVVFEPLVSSLGTLPAQSTFTVPLTIRRVSTVAARHTLIERIGPHAGTVMEAVHGPVPGGATFVGDGARRHREAIEGAGFQVGPGPSRSLAEGLLQVHGSLADPPPVTDAASWEPRYVRPPSVERTWKR